jgi:DNA polymerase III delta subunit
VRPFVLDTLAQQARRYRTAELQAALEAAAAADAKLKSSRLDAGLILDNLLLGIMAPQP